MSHFRDDEIQKLAVGDVFYECEMFTNIEARVTVAPTLAESNGKYSDGTPWVQWVWEATNTQSGETISYRLTERLSHYGPFLYRAPQYARVVDGQPVFPLLGGQP